MKSIENIYRSFPIAIQNFACTLYGYKEKRKRYGKWYEYWVNELGETEFYNKTKIKEYQEEMLNGIVENAYQNVPYYKELFDECGLRPSDIKFEQDLQKLPILTKEVINAQPEKFINENLSKRKMIKSKTSGTTGKSLKFYITEEAISFQWAVWWRHRSRFGFNFGDKHLNFTGKPIVPVNQTKPPFWRWNKAFNQALVSMQAIKQENVSSIVSFINHQNFKYWTGYPSIIHDFCLFVKENDVELTCKPDVIFLGAENIYEDQKKDIKEVTGAILTDQYGFTEGAGNASQCEYHNHHIDFEFGIMECHEPELMENGDIRGKIACTGFANKAFPFIRYEVGDIGIWESRDFECPCGRESPILKRIEGRSEDYIVTPESKRVMRFDYLFKNTSQIKEAHVVQKKLGQIIIKIVRRNDYSVITEDKLSQDVSQYISPKLDVKFEYLKEIPREANGKFRAVKSELN